MTTPCHGAHARRRDALIVDVDGTLCDVREIRHLVTPEASGSRRRDFQRFHTESISCPAFVDVVELVSLLGTAGLAVLVVTGREGRWSFVTSAWLAEHGVHYDELLMRPIGDFRPDSVIKAEMLRQLLSKYNPVLAIDDRQDIAQVWRETGIPTAMVGASGSISFSPIAGQALDVRVAKLLRTPGSRPV